MALNIRVKVGGVTDLHTARYCAGMGVEMIGLPLGEGGVSAETFLEIRGWLSGVSFVGEITGHAPPSLEGYPLDYVETGLFGFTDWALDCGKPLVLKLHAPDTVSLQKAAEAMAAHANSTSLFLLSLANKPGPQDLALLKEMAAVFPLFIEAGQGWGSPLELLEAVRPEGIALQAGREIKTGLNDFDALAAVLEALED